MARSAAFSSVLAVAATWEASKARAPVSLAGALPQVMARSVNRILIVSANGVRGEYVQTVMHCYGS